MAEGNSTTKPIPLEEFRSTVDGEKISIEIILLSYHYHVSGLVQITLPLGHPRTRASLSFPSLPQAGTE